LSDRGCRRDARERGGKRVDAQFTGDPKQPHSDKSEYRPLTQGRERVGASPQVIPTSRARFSSCRKRRLRKRRTVAARPERGYGSKRIPTAHARIGGDGLENTDLQRKECRPFAQRIPTFRARDYRPRAQGITDSPRKNGAEYRPLTQVIPTSRARLRRETPANRCILPIGSPFHVVVVCV
jgi:hypothetical protein